MALIIKGDRLPEKCDWCFYRSRCSAHARKVKEIMESKHEQVFDVFGEMRLTDCPLVEIPDEHGVLGDISDLAMSLYSELETQEIKTLDDVMKIIKKVFDNAPTVVEASK